MKTIKPNIPKCLVDKVKNWLGDDGLAFFKEMKEKHGEYSPVFLIGEGKFSMPYAVHFNEGMSIRNFMRNTGLCDDWTHNDLDDNWVRVIEMIMDGDDC